MSCFPFFVDLSGKEGLIAGGGSVALRKIEKLLPYGPRLTVVSRTFRDEIGQIEGITLVRRTFAEDLLEGKYFVIAATDDRETNHQISRLCRERGILVNVADDKEACSFLFPSLLKRGKLSIGISTEGASPSAAVYIRNQLEQLLPDHFDEMLEFLEEKRPEVKQRFHEEGQRSAFFSRMFQACAGKGQRLTEEEFCELLGKETAD